MKLSSMLAATASLASIALLPTAPAFARPGWDSPGIGSPGWGTSRWDRQRDIARRGTDSREGKVETATFVAPGDAARALGTGIIHIETAKGGLPDAGLEAAYEAAVIDQLIAAGYDTVSTGAEGQVAELRIRRETLVPAEEKRNPVSGEMTVGVSNHGSMMGMGLNIDLTKPKTALLITRLEARIRDQASGEVLWEGRADIATREGDGDWSNQAIARSLAQALFREFPGNSGHS